MKIIELQGENKLRIYVCHDCDSFLLLEYRKATKIIQWVNIDNEIVRDYICDAHAIEALEWAITSLKETKEKIENETN